MDIGAAIRAMFEGKLVRRRGWPGHLYIEPDFKYVVRGGFYSGGSMTFAACIIYVDDREHRHPGWTPSQADLLTFDWEVK